MQSILTRITSKDLERYWNKVDVRDDAECWDWLASKDGCGYGFFRLGERMERSHRAIYLLYGVVLGKFHVCHTCDNPACVNPNHHVLADHKWNMEDRDAKGRNGYLEGDSHPNSKLTLELVEKIRKEYARGSTTHRKIAKKYGVTKSTITRVLGGKTWKTS